MCSQQLGHDSQQVDICQRLLKAHSLTSSNYCPVQYKCHVFWFLMSCSTSFFIGLRGQRKVPPSQVPYREQLKCCLHNTFHLAHVNLLKCFVNPSNLLYPDIICWFNVWLCCGICIWDGNYTGDILEIIMIGHFHLKTISQKW